MNELLEAIYRAALEEVVALLTHEDPMVRLEASMAIIQSFEATEREEAEEEAMGLAEALSQPHIDRDDMAEVGEFDSADLDRKLAEAQVLEERTPPAAERAGRSAIGSGEQRP